MAMDKSTDLLSLSATCRDLLSTMRSDAVWMPIVKRIYTVAPPPASRNLLHHSEKQSDDLQRKQLSWFDQARFLCPRVRRLGFFASSSAYVSRVVYIYVEPQQRSCVIRAEQLIPRNRYKESQESPVVPTGARLDLDRTSYDLPATAPSPDAGLSFDLLDYANMFLPLFRIDPVNGARFAGPSNNELRLRLRASQTSIALVSDLESQSEDLGGGRDVRALWTLFTGRGPSRKWPTSALVGGRGSAAVRSEYDGMTSDVTHGQGLEEAEAGKTPSKTQCDLRGFHLQVLQRTSQRSNRQQQTYQTMSHAEAERALDRIERPRGGPPEILYDGRREDPADRDRVTIIQAGGAGGGALGLGGMTFRVPDSHVRGGNNAEKDEEEETEEVLRTEREDFYPIKAPKNLDSLSDDEVMDSRSGDIKAASLEGVWAGTYGPHGIELGYLSVCWSERRENRILQFVKVTGDQNVPSGELSWEILLPATSTGTSDDPDDLGTVSSVHSEQLLRWSSSVPPNSSIETYREPAQWSLGRYDGRGRVAMTGFVQPGWMEAHATLVRNTVPVRLQQGRFKAGQESDDQEETKTRQVVNEIRLAWPAMGKVSVFKRVEIDYER